MIFYALQTVGLKCSVFFVFFFFTVFAHFRGLIMGSDINLLNLHRCLVQVL